MGDRVILEHTGSVDKWGDALEDLGDGTYRFYLWHDDTDDPDDRVLRWVDFDLDEDLTERFSDLEDIQEHSTVYDVRDMVRDAQSGDPRARARYIRQYADHHGSDYVDDGPEIVDVGWFDFLRAPSGHLQRRDVTSELGQINAHRRALGMRPLDPAAAGWSDDDVVAEARRLRGNPGASSPRDDLLAW